MSDADPQGQLGSFRHEEWVQRGNIVRCSCGEVVRHTEKDDPQTLSDAHLLIAWLLHRIQAVEAKL